MIHHEGTKDTKDTKKNRGLVVSHDVIGAAIEVHRHLGPGLLESVYEAALSRELWLRRIGHQQQVPIRIEYKGLGLKTAVRLDLLVEDCVVVEVKAVEHLLPIHRSQLLTYLKVTGLRSRPPHQLQRPSPPKRDETSARWLRSPSWPSCLRGERPHHRRRKHRRPLEQPPSIC